MAIAQIKPTRTLPDLGFEKITFPNGEITFSQNEVKCLKTFDHPYLSQEVKNWAILSVTNFVDLLSFFVGFHIQVLSISWELTLNDGGRATLGMDYVLREFPIRQPEKQYGEFPKYLSWLGSSGLGIATIEYNRALAQRSIANQLVHLYKVVELLENRLIGEASAIKFFVSRGVSRSDYKKIKQIMNKPEYMVRHSPVEDQINAVPPDEVELCWDVVRSLILISLEDEHQKRVEIRKHKRKP